MSNFIQQQSITLASSSKNRQRLLREAGLDIAVRPASIDESGIKKSNQTMAYSDLTILLAMQKALNVSNHHPKEYIIAADQLCVLGTQYFDKPLTHEKACEQLHALNGQTHHLYTAVAIVKNNQTLWQHLVITTLTMRAVPLNAIESYLLAEKPYHSCGSYHYEGLGKWLFEHVLNGDESTIMGLPTLPLFNELLNLDIVRWR